LKIALLSKPFAFPGAVKTIQAGLKHLKKSSSPASVVLFSTVAVKIGMPFHASVAGAKAAVVWEFLNNFEIMKL